MVIEFVIIYIVGLFFFGLWIKNIFNERIKEEKYDVHSKKKNVGFLYLTKKEHEKIVQFVNLILDLDKPEMEENNEK